MLLNLRRGFRHVLGSAFVWNLSGGCWHHSGTNFRWPHQAVVELGSVVTLRTESASLRYCTEKNRHKCRLRGLVCTGNGANNCDRDTLVSRSRQPPEDP